MADFAAISGVIGTFTGVIALVVSIKNHARISEMKALDLRLEINRAFNNLDVVLSGIGGYLDSVHQSHINVLAATGRGQSGEMKLFEDEFASDKARLRSLLGTQPRQELRYEKHVPNELETILVSVHAFHVQISELRAKYQRLFESDEQRRKEIRAQHQR